MRLDAVLDDLARRLSLSPPSREPDVEREDCFHRGEFLGRCTSCSVSIGYPHDRLCAKVASRA